MRQTARITEAVHILISNAVYLQAIFVDELGADASCLSNATPKDDFGGGHADPNLTYAKDLVKAMGLTSKGTKNPEMESEKVRPLAVAAAAL